MTDMRVHFSVDQLLCIGCGLCHERAPENLDIDDGEHVARVYQQPRDDEEEEACHEAAEYCPTGGLTAQEPEKTTERADRPAIREAEVSDGR
jgi:ferredoxin